MLFDNHHGKAPHYHLNGKENFFQWTSRKQAEELFFHQVEKRFGYLVEEINE